MKVESQHFSFRSAEEQWQSISNLRFQFFECSWFSSVDILFGPNARMEMIWIAIEISLRPFCWFSTSSPQSRWLSSHPGTGSAKCDGARSCRKCSSSYLSHW